MRASEAHALRDAPRVGGRRSGLLHLCSQEADQPPQKLSQFGGASGEGDGGTGGEGGRLSHIAHWWQDDHVVQMVSRFCAMHSSSFGALVLCQFWPFFHPVQQ